MRNSWFVAVLSMMAFVGCEGNSKKTAMQSGPGAVSADLTEVSALPSAGTAYSNSIDAAIHMGDAIPIPIFNGFWINTDGSNVALDVGWTHYMEPMDGTGWKFLDEFNARPTGYSAEVQYAVFSDTPDDDVAWNLIGGYMMGMEKLWAKAGLSIGGFDMGTSSVDVFTSALSCDYYVTKDFSAGISWNYEHVADSSSLSWNKFRLNLGYLFDIANPVLAKLSFGTMEMNNSDSSQWVWAVSVDWVFLEKYLFGAYLQRYSDEDNWGEWVERLKINFGYEITANIIVGLGFFDVMDSSGPDSETGFNVTYSQKF